MKTKKQEAPKSKARSNSPTADPNAGDPEDLREMWSAVAALLDDTTVDTGMGSAPLAHAPMGVPSNSTVPAAPDAAPAPPAVPAANTPPLASAPVDPPAATLPPAQTPPAHGSSVGQKINDLFSPFWKQPQKPNAQHPSAEAPPAPPNPDAHADPHASRPANQPAPTAGNPAPNGNTENNADGTPRTRNGKPLTPPYAPGAGPQVLPAPDAWLPTPPVQTPPADTSPAYARPAALPRTAGEPFILPEGLETHSVAIRGRNDGVGIEMGEGKWDDLLYVLAYRVEQTDGFFRGGTIAVDVGNRHVAEPELHQLRSILSAYGMEPSVLRTTSERTFQAALAVGIPCTQIGADGAPVNEALIGASDEAGAGFFIYRGSLRSGQVLYRRENIIVIGDVNPGAEVVSDGDVMVWGRMRGIAHAGARGNQHAVITALDMDPVQIRIDTIIGAAQAGISPNGPRWGASRSADRRAEIARLINGKLTIQHWDEAKTGGVALLKRRFS